MRVFRLSVVIVSVVLAVGSLVGCSHASSRASTRGNPSQSATTVGSGAVVGATYCPVAGEFPSKPRLPGVSGQLVPFTPARAELCRIERADDGTDVATAAVLDGSAARRLAALLDSARQSPFAHGVFSCPADFGTGLRADFSDAAGHHLEVFVADSGCAAARNGAFTAVIPSALPALLAHVAPSLPTFTIR